MTQDADKVAQARAIWRRSQDEALDASPLAGMAAWVESGRPPHRDELVAAGFSGANPVTPESSLVRGGFNRRWGFSIPCREAVEALKSLGPLVEVGAGTGYWTALLSQAGCDVIATDAIATGDVGYGFAAGRHAEVLALSALESVRRYPDRALFCSWPTRGEAWAEEMLGLLPSGRRAGLILEPADGKTATPAFYETLRARFRRITDVALPQFPGNRDRLYLVERA